MPALFKPACRESVCHFSFVDSINGCNYNRNEKAAFDRIRMKERQKMVGRNNEHFENPATDIHPEPSDRGNIENKHAFSEILIRQIRRLTRIGTALSAERNIERLFEMIVEEARALTGADGGTLYIMSDDETELRFTIVRTGTLQIRMGGEGGKITWKPVLLRNPDGYPNHENVSAHAALTGRTINIHDVYDAEGFDFQGTRKFDAQTGYRSKSMLVVPMKNHENDIIGVLQLLNAQDDESGKIIPFSLECQEMTESLASQAAVALSNNRLIHDLEELMESIIRAIATAIDEKSPYTGGHVRRVADLAMEIAYKINETSKGSFADVRFSDDQMKELRIAAWLHDLGKITTPEFVVDKATKLETIFDRIELLRLRFELCQLQAKMNMPTRIALESDYVKPSDHMDKVLREEFQFLSEVNAASEWMSDEMAERVLKIGERKYMVNGKSEPLLSYEEIENLIVRHGTLTSNEREIIRNHVTMTYRILSELPFPKKLRNVAEFASSHHETLDGKGYPRGLVAAQLPLQSRILALADVFEALTAEDRPYGKPKTFSDIMSTMETMVQQGHIDPNLYALFKEEGMHLKYARREMSPDRMDFIKPD